MKEIGDLGEQLLSRWLELHDYQILKRNWRCRWGEMDIVAQDKVSGLIAFVEVKTRSDRNWDADGLLAIDSNKQQKLTQTASLFLAKHPELAELPCRFDVGLVSYQLLDTKSDPAVNIKSEVARINDLKIAEAIVIDRYRLTIKDYLQAAFD